MDKNQAARWCSNVLPLEWDDLIKAAIAGRPNPWERIRTTIHPSWTALTRKFIEEVTPRIVAASTGPLRNGD